MEERIYILWLCPGKLLLSSLNILILQLVTYHADQTRKLYYLFLGGIKLNQKMREKVLIEQARE